MIYPRNERFSLKACPLISILVRLPIHKLLFMLDNCIWNPNADAEKHENRPLPSERVECHAKDEPPDQLEIREEVKSARWAEFLQRACHVDPALHPPSARSCQGVKQEHEEDASVDANVPVTDSTNCLHKGGVDGGDGWVSWRESLQVPVWWSIWILETVIRKDCQRGSLKASCHDDHVCLDELLVTRAVFWNTAGTTVNLDAALLESFNVAADPFCFALAQLVHNIRVDHWRAHKEALVVSWRQILEISVKELAKEKLGDEGEESFLAKDVETEQRVYKHVSRNDPFVRSRKDGDLGCAGFESKFECFDGGCSSTDDGDVLILGILSVAVTVSSLKLKTIDDWTYPVSSLEW